jgi:hypothetical protein
MSIMEDIILALQPITGGYCQVRHKRGWLNYLENGRLYFGINQLLNITYKTVRNNPPKGEKLFKLERHYQFTVKGDGTAYRPEEALERFIILSNPEYYNQIPIGGRKESIDLGFENSDSSFVFVELKPWSINNSPVYAIIESLKNLIEYRAILETNQEIKRYDHIDLFILAPLSYYKNYGLIDLHNNHVNSTTQTLKHFISALSSAVDTSISFMTILIDRSEFDSICIKHCNENAIKGQKIISIENHQPIPILQRENWKIIVTSN